MKLALIQREFSNCKIVSISFIYIVNFQIDVNEDGNGGEGDEFNIWR
jgi:hypothetical protein